MGDGQEEALFQGRTRIAGASNVGYSCVLKLRPNGKLIGLPIKPPRMVSITAKTPFRRACAPKKREGTSSKSSRLLQGAFRWDGGLILDEVTGIPPGNQQMDDVAPNREAAPRERIDKGYLIVRY
jgi:hypothetical protein